MSRSYNRRKHYSSNPLARRRMAFFHHMVNRRQFLTFGMGSTIDPRDHLDEVQPYELPKVARLPRAAQEG